MKERRKKRQEAWRDVCLKMSKFQQRDKQKKDHVSMYNQHITHTGGAQTRLAVYEIHKARYYRRRCNVFQIVNHAF